MHKYVHVPHNERTLCLWSSWHLWTCLCMHALFWTGIALRPRSIVFSRSKLILCREREESESSCHTYERRHVLVGPVVGRRPLFIFVDFTNAAESSKQRIERTNVSLHSAAWDIHSLAQLILEAARSLGRPLSSYAYIHSHAEDAASAVGGSRYRNSLYYSRSFNIICITRTSTTLVLESTPY